MAHLKQKLKMRNPSAPRSRFRHLPSKGETNIVILALETSCDETAAAVLSVSLSGGLGATNWPKIQTLSSVVKSQIKLHSKFGGVVPEAAARAHVKNILPITQKAIKDSGLKIKDISSIAVTIGPGLLPSLMVGVEFAKGLSFALDKPIISVNHLLGHLYSPLTTPTLLPPQGGGMKGEGIFPMISLIVSGGHTILVLLENARQYKILGQTVDDAAGEAFDKVAKLLKLPYPGGPEVSRLAERGNPNAINFPRPMIHHKNYNFSFSGLKTAVLYYLRDHPLSFPPRIKYGVNSSGNLVNKYILDSGSPSASLRGGRNDIADICASFQQAVVDVLVAKTLRAAKEFKVKSISLSGGVAANKNLRESLKLKAKSLKLNFFVPPLKLCTDNAEMVGIAAAFLLHNGFKSKSYKTVSANPNLEL